ncbi:MAG: MlaD family protein [Opitutia bacterium]|jgi:paraquat-inducible protein B
MSTSANRTLIGVFVLLGLALCLAFLVALGGGWLKGDRPRLLARFDQDVSGLDTGSAVRLRGVAVGKVASILIRTGNGDAKSIPVVIEIDPDLAERLGVGDTLGTQEGLEQAVLGGLTAKLRLQSFVTGILYVDLDYIPVSGERQIRRADGMAEIPTELSDHVALTQAVSRTVGNLSQVDFSGLSAKLGRLADSVNRLAEDPALAQATRDLSAAMAAFNRVSEKLSQQIEPLGQDFRLTAEETRRTLGKLGQAADNLQDLTRAGGATRTQLDQALVDFAEAAQSVKSLADTLDRNPEAILKGKRRPAEEPTPAK